MGMSRLDLHRRLCCTGVSEETAHLLHSIKIDFLQTSHAPAFLRFPLFLLPLESPFLLRTLIVFGCCLEAALC